MNSALLEKIVDAVLYEGYILHPYRPSSKKNRRERFTFGRVYPKKYSDSQDGKEPCLSQTFSPVILYDYPRIAPESAGGFFDGTEIDEMLTLRVGIVQGLLVK